MKAKLHYVLTTTMFLVVFSSFAQNNFFVKMSKGAEKSQSSKDKLRNRSSYQFNYNSLKACLAKAHTPTNQDTDLVVSFPNLNGDLKQFKIVEASVLPKALQDKYPDIRSYIGYGIDNPTHYLRFSLSPNKGLCGIILGQHTPLVFEPSSKNRNEFKVMLKTDVTAKTEFKCQTETEIEDLAKKSVLTQKNANNTIKRTYRLALSVTGEYAEFHGGTLENINAALVASLTNVNAAFENDLNISLELVPNNDDVLFLNSQTDPYGDSPGNYGFELRNVLNNLIGVNNYDLGHLLSAIGFAGNANCIGCVCDDDLKGSAYSSDNIPSGFNFDIDLFAHELGHQFGANHTWTHEGNEQTGVQMEPGSGTTIMGYSGIARSANILLHSDPYFHAISIAQISDYVSTTGCAVTSNTGSAPLLVNAGEDLTLPIGTPFRLIGDASSTDNATLSYCWEQINDNNARTVFPNPDGTDSNAVLFRSFPPTVENTRFFPNISDLSIGLNAGQWEKIPNVSRSADFRLTVRDNKSGGGNTNYDDVNVRFDSNYGPFEITTLDSENIFLVAGETQIIQWNVNNTNLLPGASTVDVLLSTDDGVTFETIATNAPNNGEFLFEVPDTVSTTCRLMIAPTNANFFAINANRFTIGLETNTDCVTYSSNSNLGLDIIDGTQSFSQSHTITITDTGIISDLNIGVDLAHSFIGDLSISLTSPSGTEIPLKTTRSCGDDLNLIATFDDDAIAFSCADSGENLRQGTPDNTLLAAFNGESIAGDWTLHLGDFAAGDEGVLNSWFIEICNSNVQDFSINDTIFSAFTVSPNPSLNSGIFKLRAPSLHSPKTIRIEVYNTQGQRVYEQDFPETTFFNEVISIENARTGLYFLNLMDGSDRFMRKLLIR